MHFDILDELDNMSYEEASKYGMPLSNEPNRVDMGELVLQEDGTYCATN